jgi:hypothetical protein
VEPIKIGVDLFFFSTGGKNKNEKKVPQLKNTQKYTASLW